MEFLAKFSLEVGVYSAVGGCIGAIIGWLISFALERYKFHLKKRELLFAIRVEALHALNTLNESLFAVEAFFSSTEDDQWWDYLSFIAVRKIAIKGELRGFQKRYQHILPKDVQNEILESLDQVAGIEDLGIEGVESSAQALKLERQIAAIKLHIGKAYASLSKCLIS